MTLNVCAQVTVAKPQATQPTDIYILRGIKCPLIAITLFAVPQVRDMMDEKSGPLMPRNIWIFIFLLAIVLGGIWLWVQSEQSAEPAPSSASQPSSEWTTAPEGGVKVNLPETPMTNAPVDAPNSDSEQQGRATSE